MVKKGFRVVGWIVMLGYCTLTMGYWQPATAQETWQIVGVDVSRFPQVQFRLMADEPVTNLEGLTLRENGVPIADFVVNPVPVGIDVVFVLDANEAIQAADGGETTRLSQVQDSIGRFATQFMSPTGLDRVSVVVPDEDGVNGRFLIQDSASSDTLLEAVYGYNPNSPTVTPLGDMMELAVEHLGQIRQNGRFQAILLFSDAILLAEQVKVEGLVSQAQAIRLPIFVAILGQVATFVGVDNAALLHVPTGGAYVPLPSAEETDSFYRQWLSRSNQPQITYQSPQKLNGRYTFSISLGTFTASSEYELVLQPPTVTLLWSETTIRRLGDRPDSLLSDLQPMHQAVLLQISWPDGISRPLKRATLFVNGQEQPSPPLQQPDETGVIALEWNFRYLDAGPYELTAQVVDDLGWVGTSEPLTVQITVERPIPVTPTPVPTPIPPEPITLPLPRPENALTALGISGGGIFIFGLLLAVRRRRRRRTPITPAVEPVQVAELLMEEGKTAVLRQLNGTPDNEQQFMLDNENIIIGRDLHIAQVVLDDKTVSRLHARIRRREDGYWLYDEGSATGTYLNFERLGLTPRRLHHQDRIGIGRFQLQFWLEEGRKAE